VAEPVIKYQTVRLDEEMKRQKKLGGIREKRLARKPRKTAAAATPAVPATPAPESAPAASAS
jgi:small subunit ribosomal protein S6